MWVKTLLLGLGGSCPLPSVTMKPAHPVGVVYLGPREDRGRAAPKLHPALWAQAQGTPALPETWIQDGPLMHFPLHLYFPT